MTFLADIDVAGPLGHTVAMAVTSLVLALIWGSAQRESSQNRGSRVVAYPRGLRIFVSLGWLLVGGLLVVAWFHAHDEALQPILGIVVMSCLLVLPLHLEAFDMRITWDDLHIRTHSPWRRSRTIPFSAVRSCDYSKSMQWYRIRTAGHGIIRLPILASGIPDLLAALPCPTPPLQKIRLG